MEIKSCPFCGNSAKFFAHGYSNDVAEVGCSNRDCCVQPRATVKPDIDPLTDAVLWDDAEKKAVDNWNQRA